MDRVTKRCTLALCLSLASILYPGSDAFSVCSSSRGGGGGGGARSAAFVAPSSLSPTSSFVRRGPAALSMAEDEDDDVDSSSSSSSGASPPSTLTRLPESSVEIAISVPGSATRAAYDRACADLSRSLTVPGFRKGAKIPPPVIESTLAQRGDGRNAVRERAVQSLVEELVGPALRDEHGLEPIGTPSLDPGVAELAEGFGPGEPLELRVRCDVWPEVGWSDPPEGGREKPYHGLKGSYKRKPFDGAKFDKALADLRDRYATLGPAEEGAPLENGDACTVDMVGYMANEDGSKGDPLPDKASGDDVEVVLGEGRYMEGLVEGLLGAKVGETVTVLTSFPEALVDKTLAGKRAIFDVTVKGANKRTIPDVTDEFAAKVKPGLTAEGLMKKLRTAVDSEDAKEFVNERNEALGKALADVVAIEVPDSLITNQAREKFAVMMTDFRDQGMADEEIKRQITPDNFLKYKNISKNGIVRDFKISMAVDEIARLESIDVPAYQVDEQMGALKKEMAEFGQEQDEDVDEAALRSRVESTLQRRLVFDYLAENADLDVEYTDEAGDAVVDVNLLNDIAAESLARERGISVDEAKAEIEGESAAAAEDGAAAAEDGAAAATEDGAADAAAVAVAEADAETAEEEEEAPEDAAATEDGAASAAAPAGSDTDTDTAREEEGAPERAIAAEDGTASIGAPVGSDADAETAEEVPEIATAAEDGAAAVDVKAGADAETAEEEEEEAPEKNRAAEDGAATSNAPAGSEADAETAEEEALEQDAAADETAEEDALEQATAADTTAEEEALEQAAAADETAEEEALEQAAAADDGAVSGLVADTSTLRGGYGILSGVLSPPPPRPSRVVTP